MWLGWNAARYTETSQVQFLVQLLTPHGVQRGLAHDITQEHSVKLGLGAKVLKQMTFFQNVTMPSSENVFSQIIIITIDHRELKNEHRAYFINCSLGCFECWC